MKILIVDDSKAMRMLVSFNLKQAGFKGHTIIEAENGLIGLQQVKEHNPDVVLSDWNMPEMNGIELLQQLNTLQNDNQIPRLPAFMFVTSESTHDMLELALSHGALGLITKPFSADVFERKLSDIIQ